MPQRKPPQPFYGWHRFILVKLAQHFKKRKIKLPKSAFWLVFFGCYPERLNHPWYKNKDLNYKERDLFVDAFAQRHGQTLEILEFTRKMLKRFRANALKHHRIKALDFLLSHNCLVEKRGTGNQETKFFLLYDPKITDRDRDKPGAVQMVPDLTDGDIARFLGIPADSVKEARQLLASQREHFEKIPSR